MSATDTASDGVVSSSGDNDRTGEAVDLGDVDGDGLADLLVGAGSYGSNGRAWLYLGFEATDPGFSVGAKERKLGIKGSPTCEIYLEDCTIPADRIIGKPGSGFKTALRTLDHTRLAIGAQALGIAQGAFDAAVRRFIGGF